MHRNFSVKSAFFGVHKKKWEHYWVPNNKGTELIAITDFLYLVCASHSFSFVCSTIFFFCVSVRCVYICCFSSLNQHWINICLRFHVATLCLCIWVCFWLWFIRQYSFFAALKLNAHPSLWYLRWNMSPHRFTLYFSLITLCVFVCTVVFCHCFARERFYMLYALQKQQQMPQPSSI